MTFKSKQIAWLFDHVPFYNPHRYTKPIIVFLLFFQILVSYCFGQIKVAALGDFPLQNGQVIQDCKIAYQTFGRLNTTGSNAILVPTWYGGTSSDLISYIGEDQMLDSTKYFIIVVDAFGNGISSSPSTSISQKDNLFPEFSIFDLVASQHRLLVDELGIEHLPAVTGISMGGIQTYQWMASYPSFFDLAVPIVGSPLLSSYELLVFESFERLMSLAESGNREEVSTISLMLEYALGFSPEFRAENTFVEDFPEFIHGIEKQSSDYSPFDLRSQMRAISSFNIAEKSGDLSLVAENFHGDALVVYATQDALLRPESSKRFAALLNAEVLELNSDCGHYSFACEKDKISKAVKGFLHQLNQ